MLVCAGLLAGGAVISLLTVPSTADAVRPPAEAVPSEGPGPA